MSSYPDGVGHAAKTYPLGMGRFAPEWIVYFAGKDVCIMPDNSVQNRVAAYRLIGQLLQVCGV